MISKVKFEALWGSEILRNGLKEVGGVGVGKYQFDFSFFFQFFPTFENLKYYLKYREHQKLLST